MIFGLFSPISSFYPKEPVKGFIEKQKRGSREEGMQGYTLTPTPFVCLQVYSQKHNQVVVSHISPYILCKNVVSLKLYFSFGFSVP